MYRLEVKILSVALLGEPEISAGTNLGVLVNPSGFRPVSMGVDLTLPSSPVPMSFSNHF